LCLYEWLLLSLKLEDEAFKKNKIDPLKKRHSLRMGSFVSCCGPNMCRDWNLLRTILQNCQVLSFIARKVWVVEGHCRSGVTCGFIFKARSCTPLAFLLGFAYCWHVCVNQKQPFLLLQLHDRWRKLVIEIDLTKPDWVVGEPACFY
jgi:hypothetical protein